MKIAVYSWENDDWLISQELYINEKYERTISPLCECPEDAIVGRSLVSADEIIKYMRLAYEAGTKGEPFECEKIEGKKE